MRIKKIIIFAEAETSIGVSVMKEVTLQVPDGKTVEWKEINGVTLPVLVDVPAEKDNRPVTERIKTFEDALKELGDNNDLVRHYALLLLTETLNSEACEYCKDVIAVLKLRIITAALNEGWQPKFDKENDEYRYYPYFEILTADEIAELSDGRKQELGLVGAVAPHGAAAPLAFVCSKVAWSAASSRFGSRLAYKSRELALYSGRQFKELWAQWCFLPALEK